MASQFLEAAGIDSVNRSHKSEPLSRQSRALKVEKQSLRSARGTFSFPRNSLYCNQSLNLQNACQLKGLNQSAAHSSRRDD